MSEKLTLKELESLAYVHRLPKDLAIVLMEAIESDRKAIRAETRAEVLKDHAKLGEDIEVRNVRGVWIPCIMVAKIKGETDNWISGTNAIRRPPKMRPMTREEKIEALQDVKVESVRPFIFVRVKNLSNSAIDELCYQHSIPTEVEES